MKPELCVSNTLLLFPLNFSLQLTHFSFGFRTVPYYISVVFCYKSVKISLKTAYFHILSNSLEKKFFRILLFFSVLTFFINSLYSQPLFFQNGAPSHPQVMGHSSATRSIIDLAGIWDYSLDNGITWQKVKVPSAANYEGEITFRRKFFVELATITNSAFKFVSYGMNYRAQIYINEIPVGSHEGGYTSFVLPIPDNVIQVGKENVIRVVVDNTLDYKSTFPPRPQVSGWKNYGGIMRDIFIVATPRIWVDDVNVVVEGIEPRAIRLLVTASVAAREAELARLLENKTAQVAVEVSEAASGAVIGKPVITPVTLESNNTVAVQISVLIPNAKLWSPETPDLYNINVHISATDGKRDSLIDETSITTGIRTFIKDKNILLSNGARTSLRGVVWIEDSEQHGSAITYEEMERDVALIKNLGANTVRVAFHPPHPFFIQLCNRYGLFVLEEIPNYEIPAGILEEEHYRAVMENYLQEVIQRDKHHPSVIAWGLGDGSGSSEDILLHLHRTAKSIDDRLTYYVARKSKQHGISIPDIAAISFSDGDIKTFRSRLTEFTEALPRHPIIIAGYGKPVEKGNRNGYSDPHSQEAQGRYILQRHALLKDFTLGGSIIFSFNDFRSDRPILSIQPIVPYVHTVGIVELDRQKKTAYDVVHSLYHDQKISALPVGAYVTPLPYIYVMVGLALLIVAAWLINGNRRFRESTRRAVFNSYNFFADIRDQFTLPLFHTTVTALIISATFALIVSSILHHFRSSAVLDYLISFFFPDEVKLILIRIAWNPAVSIVYLSGAMMAWFLVLTFFIQFFSKIARVKIRLFHSYSIAVWTALPWAFFIPVGMILYRVLQSEPYVPWVTGIVLFMSFWIYLRTLKGISVIYNIYTPKMYGIGITLLIVIVGGIVTYMDYTFSIFAYTEFFLHSVLPFVR